MRLLLVLAGLVFAASLAVLMLVLLALWGLRAVWCKLTGQPINPLAAVMRGRMNPRAGFDHVFKPAEQGATPLRKPARNGMDDVTDVEPKG